MIGTHGHNLPLATQSVIDLHTARMDRGEAAVGAEGRGPAAAQRNTCYGPIRTHLELSPTTGNNGSTAVRMDPHLPLWQRHPVDSSRRSPIAVQILDLLLGLCGREHSRRGLSLRLHLWWLRLGLLKLWLRLGLLILRLRFGLLVLWLRFGLLILWLWLRLLILWLRLGLLVLWLWLRLLILWLRFGLLILWLWLCLLKFRARLLRLGLLRLDLRLFMLLDL